MKQQLKNKLVLDRETVAVLQSDALDGIHGGVAATGCIQPPSRGLGCSAVSNSGVTSQLVSCNSQISGISRQVSEQISRQVSWGGQGR